MVGSLRRAHILIAGLVIAGATLGVAGPARAEGDLDVAAELDYRLDPDAGVVRVQTRLRLENTKPDQQMSGGTRYFFFTDYAFPVPREASIVSVATAGGTPLAYDLQPIEGSEDYLRLGITFDHNLRYGHVFDIVVDYDFVGAPPRDGDDLYRTNQAVMSFPVTPWGDPGQSDVRIEVPSGFAVTTFGDGLSLANQGAVTIYSATDIAKPDEFFAVLIAQDDNRLTSRQLDLGDASFRIRAWPGDDAWADFAAAQITRGLPVLEEMLGQPWPNGDTFDVMESVDPALVGYAGWYDGLQQRIEFDDQTVLHELSHAWFNSDLLLSRWMSEGLAETYAELAIERLGDTPDEPVGAAHGDRGALRLAEWDVPTGTDDEIRDTETFGYAASHLVVSSITEEIGVGKMSEVMAAMEAGTTSYLVDDQPIVLGPHIDWRRFLDLVEDVGGSTSAEGLYRDWVVRDTELGELDARAATRTRYHELATRAAAWAMPEGVARSMAAWNFSGAAERMDAAGSVLDAREAADAVLGPLGLVLPVSVGQAYASSVSPDDLAAVTTTIRRYQQVGEVLAGSRTEAEAPRTFIERVGLRGADPEADADAAIAAFKSGDLDRAVASAQRAVARWDEAERIGKQRLIKAGAGALGGIVVLVGVGLWVRRRRRRRRTHAAGAPGTLPAAGSDGVGASSLGSDVVGSDGVGIPGEPVTTPSQFAADPQGAVRTNGVHLASPAGPLGLDPPVVGTSAPWPHPIERPDA